MDSDLAGLEQKLAVLLADYHRVRAENESLKRELVPGRWQLAVEGVCSVDHDAFDVERFARGTARAELNVI